MTEDEIKERIKSIGGCGWDHEQAHGLEDRLYIDFVRYVAEVAPPSLAAKAQLVLSTLKMDFERWCG